MVALAALLSAVFVVIGTGVASAATAIEYGLIAAL
jgi:Flp pilus assembly pilin Flp